MVFHFVDSTCAAGIGKGHCRHEGPRAIHRHESVLMPTRHTGNRVTHSGPFCILCRSAYRSFTGR